MDDLITFLRAQIDIDEQIAKAAADGLLWHGPVKTGSVWEADRGFVFTEGQVPGVWDECLWKADTPGRYTREMSEHCGHHVARHDPARVLAEVDAKRKIIDEHAEPGDDNVICRVCREPWQGDFTVPLPCPTLRLLALPYAGHPDYRQEWKP
ncbi:DUF6221 family protein [Amycolatopsis sp. VS8301801F10]|uniref:DUF6221 family protein n=1 Tax=Amycolatopsis sp. VS8301801F10 TaxID=2652442 RepID=UPI0038FC768C